MRTSSRHGVSYPGALLHRKPSPIVSSGIYVHNRVIWNWEYYRPTINDRIGKLCVMSKYMPGKRRKHATKDLLSLGLMIRMADKIENSAY